MKMRRKKMRVWPLAPPPKELPPPWAVQLVPRLRLGPSRLRSLRYRKVLRRRLAWGSRRLRPAGSGHGLLLVARKLSPGNPRRVAAGGLSPVRICRRSQRSGVPLPTMWALLWRPTTVGNFLVTSAASAARGLVTNARRTWLWQL
ncbi:hypothetical protein BU23DRAFT_201386 [Bimuria novae-zelandiae CBS 107.79]|uniref:Uncharacterized protein n=1 Tax=Bimuria novae-zelandiae CBS 107.79 TaxID=1447943 RepID=A0A6A5V4A4_9PLEO|nr:hypothetical protein BU23DRAFT_201386 [Bimuria novae-zelandiae CBS 107.79]